MYVVLAEAKFAVDLGNSLGGSQSVAQLGSDQVAVELAVVPVVVLAGQRLVFGPVATLDGVVAQPVVANAVLAFEPQVLQTGTLEKCRSGVEPAGLGFADLPLHLAASHADEGYAADPCGLPVRGNLARYSYWLGAKTGKSFLRKLLAS